MNEELQKQLILILQGMRENADPVFQVLLNQRATYAGVMALEFIAACMLCIIISLWFLKKSKSFPKDSDGEHFSCVFSGVFFGIACGTFCASLRWIPVAIAPLGEILGMLSK